MNADIKQLQELGFTNAATRVEQQREAAPTELRQKLRIAFEHFRVVEPEKIAAFGEKLKKKTYRKRVYRHSRHSRTLFESWMRPQFTPIGRYPSVPPADVLEALKKAKELQCFDGFEIMTLEKHTNQTTIVDPPPDPDPILFGRIIGSDLRYFVAQWDDDVAIEDILKEGEG